VEASGGAASPGNITQIAIVATGRLVLTAAAISALVRLAAGGQLGLGAAGVDIDVLLAGKLRDRLHDLVGDSPQQLAVGLLAVVAGEVKRLAEPYAWPEPGVRPERARRLELEGVDHGARDHRSARFDGEPSDPGLAAVQAAIRAAGAFRVDAEHMPGRQDAQAGPDRLLARRPPGPVERNLADPGEEDLADQALDAASGEVLRLGQEDHLPRHRQRPEEVVGERQVIAREDDGTSARNVLDTRRAGPEDDLQRHAERVLRKPVEHGHIVPCPGATPGRAP